MKKYLKEPPKRISITTGAHPTTRQERIQETIIFSVVAIVLIVVTTWAFHLTDGWLVMLIWAIIIGIYIFALHDTWTRQSTEERKNIKNPIDENQN